MILTEIPALKADFIHLLRQCLQRFSSDPMLTLIEIPLHHLDGERPGQYQSAIAHRLCGLFNTSAITIATQIVAQIQSKTTESLLFRDKLNSESESVSFTLQTMPSGMILLELTDVGLANWLHHITYSSLVETEKLPASDFQGALFNIQHSHARCCSLLRRSHQAGLITLTSQTTPTTPISWQLDWPCPLPWLTATQ